MDELDQPGGMVCPRCEPETALREWGPGGALHACPRCGGTFVDEGDLGVMIPGLPRLYALTTDAPISLDADRALACPRCRRGMAERVLRGSDEALSVCGACRGAWLPDGMVDRLKPLAVVARRPREEAAEDARPRAQSDDAQLAFSRVEFGGPFASFFALPSVFVLAALLFRTELGKLISYLVGMPFHELGHAIVSWLGGRFAIPLPFMTFYLGGRSVWVFALLWLAVAALMYYGWRERRPFVIVLGAVVMALQVTFTFVISEHKLDEYFYLGGQLGEIALSTLALSAFYFKLPDRVRWDFWRWFALLPSAICLLRARNTWAASVGDLKKMPLGAALGSQDDGDLNRLLREYGWRPQEIADFFSRATYVALAVLLILFMWHAVAYRRRQGATPVAAP